MKQLKLSRPARRRLKIGASLSSVACYRRGRCTNLSLCQISHPALMFGISRWCAPEIAASFVIMLQLDCRKGMIAVIDEVHAIEGHWRGA
jgi:hypothetical protein